MTLRFWTPVWGIFKPWVTLGRCKRSRQYGVRTGMDALHQSFTSKPVSLGHFPIQATGSFMASPQRVLGNHVPLGSCQGAGSFCIMLSPFA